MPSTGSEADSTLGIHGKLQHSLADANHEDVTLVVCHQLGDDLSHTAHISHDNLRKAAGVSHMNLLRPESMTVECQNLSGGLAAVTVKGGDGEPLPVTNRHCAHLDNGAMVASHVIAMPNATTASGDMHFKQLPTDKHNYIRPENMSDPDNERAKLNAVHYAGQSAPPTEAKLMDQCITAKHEGRTRIAVPIMDKITADMGGLSQVATRCVRFGKKPVTALCTSGSPAIIKMPHKDTGEEVDHLVADADAINAMANTVKMNTQINGTFANGLSITANGLGDESSPGDMVTTVLKLKRKPTGDPKSVTLQRDLMPKELAAGTVTLADGAASHSANHQKWHDAMFKPVNKKAMGAAPQIEHTEAAGGDAQATPIDNEDEGN